MKESDFQTKFNRWLKYRFNGSAVFELKLARGDSLLFSAVKDHQEQALLLVKHSKIVYKIPDDTQQQKPFDCLAFEGLPAYVVIMYDFDRTTFYLIDIDKWIKEKRISVKRSLHESRAAKIGKRCQLG